MEIDIPAWIDTGMIIKMTGEGNDGVWTQAKWDLYVKFQVPNEEKWLKRDGVDLYYSVEIDILESVLWTTKEVNIPVIGKRKIEIKAWTQPWETLELVWDGVKNIDSEKKGSLFITLGVKIPKKLGKKERELYEEIASEKKVNVHNKKWVLEKLFN